MKRAVCPHDFVAREDRGTAFPFRATRCSARPFRRFSGPLFLHPSAQGVSSSNCSKRIFDLRPNPSEGVITMKANLYIGTAFIAAIATACAFAPPVVFAAEGSSLLAGKVTSSAGEALAGIPVKAHRNGSAITVAVYTDAKGEYTFPAWSDLKPGSYSVGIELPDFDHVAQPVVVSAGKAAQAHFTVTSEPPAYEDHTASGNTAGLPGTDHQKVSFFHLS